MRNETMKNIPTAYIWIFTLQVLAGLNFYFIFYPATSYLTPLSIIGFIFAYGAMWLRIDMLRRGWT